MRVWLLTVGEPLPLGGSDHRLHRTGMLAQTLVRRGHDVVWWTSTFDHFSKRHLFPADTVVDVGERYRIRLFHSLGYGQNISVRRMLDHKGVARKFARQGPVEAKPDIVLSSLPTLELCLEAVSYGKAHGVPVILDIRDLWPDIFEEVAPRWAKWAARLALGPLFRTVRAACNGATALCGIAPGFVQWGANYAGRPIGVLDRDFPLGYLAEPPREEELSRAKEFWAGLGLGEKKGEFVVAFVGTMGRRNAPEFLSAIRAAKLLEERTPAIRFVFSGTGENLAAYQAAAGGAPNILFPGWIDRPAIWSLLRLASVGLLPYENTPDFLQNLPNKVFEYLCLGLPILSPLKGEVKGLLEKNRCGMTYRSGDPEHLAEVLDQLSRDPDRLLIMSRRGTELFSSCFDADKVYSSMADHLEEVAKDKSGELSG